MWMNPVVIHPGDSLGTIVVLLCINPDVLILQSHLQIDRYVLEGVKAAFIGNENINYLKWKVFPVLSLVSLSFHHLEANLVSIY